MIPLDPRACPQGAGTQRGTRAQCNFEHQILKRLWSGRHHSAAVLEKCYRLTRREAQLTAKFHSRPTP
jgi:hypothetical protein